MWLCSLMETDGGNKRFNRTKSIWAGTSALIGAPERIWERNKVSTPESCQRRDQPHWHSQGSMLRGPRTQGASFQVNALLPTSWNTLTVLNREPYPSQIMYSAMLRGQGYDQLRSPGSLNVLCYTLQNLTQVRYRTAEEIRGNRRALGLRMRKNLEPHPDSTIHSWTNH